MSQSFETFVSLDNERALSEDVKHFANVLHFVHCHGWHAALYGRITCATLFARGPRIFLSLHRIEMLPAKFHFSLFLRQLRLRR